MSTAQLRGAGLGRGAIESRARRAWLHRVHRGVYAVGHRRLSYRGRLWAAILAYGGVDAAFLSHRTAAAVYDLLPPPAGRIELTILGEAKSTPAVRVHRSRTLDPVDDVVCQPDGLPVTTVARTLVDLAQVLTQHRLERVCHRAEILRRLDTAAVEESLGRLTGRHSHNLRRALATLTSADPDITRSELEERFLALVAAGDLPRPLVNASVAGYEVDFLWPERRLVVETDGAAVHGTIRAFEDDRRRDAALQVAGHRVIRFTWRRVIDDPGGVLRTLRALR